MKTTSTPPATNSSFATIESSDESESNIKIEFGNKINLRNLLLRIPLSIPGRKRGFTLINLCVSFVIVSMISSFLNNNSLLYNNQFQR
ncbi:hypothetical protein MtrunA17_Chr2g0308281 [Medicago truncatula]|uniref:Transmembrane protein n=1 Tax=Medicago truncatula TaxID=3880 RepID=A0A396JD66_MEDTR|nr:hypothetical protein MtrunA17_Chr2g0308281 [Medicago truncatula]